MTGLVILSQQIGTGKAEGYHEFSKSWQVSCVADTILWILIILPGIVISSLIVNFHYDMAYDLSFTIILVFL